MRANPIRLKWQANEPVVNGWLSIPHAFVAETMAHQGWDSLTIDMQHGAVDYQGAFTEPRQSLRRNARLSCVFRGRSRCIDESPRCWRYCVICPMISNRAEAETFIGATTYPPRGQRSYGPIRGLLYGGPDYASQADETIVRFAMIETKEALDNLDEILSVMNWTLCMWCRADLSRALGCEPRFDQETPIVVEAIDHILACATAAGKPAGIDNGTAAYAKCMIEKGFRFVTIGSDARFIANGSRAALEEIRRVPT